VPEQSDAGIPRVTAIEHEHGGTIDKFIGDAMLIFSRDRRRMLPSLSVRHSSGQRGCS
jgi:hypothetical protein